MDASLAAHWGKIPNLFYSDSSFLSHLSTEILHNYSAKTFQPNISAKYSSRLSFWRTISNNILLEHRYHLFYSSWSYVLLFPILNYCMYFTNAHSPDSLEQLVVYPGIILYNILFCLFSFAKYFHFFPAMNFFLFLPHPVSHFQIIPNLKTALCPTFKSVRRQDEYNPPKSSPSGCSQSWCASQKTVGRRSQGH